MKTIILQTVTIFLLLYAPGIYAQEILPGIREPFLWPYSKTSIWNTPIGSNAIYKPANLEEAEFVGVDTQHIIELEDDFPTYDVFAAPGFGPGRCTGTEQLPFDLQFPPDLIIPDAGNSPFGNTPNSNYAIIFPDGEQVLQGTLLSRCEADGPIYLPGFLEFPANRATFHIKGDGLDAAGGQGASGMSTLGGTIRLGELINDEPIRHALKINPWASKYLFYSDSIPGFKWPAKTADTYANDPTSPIRYNINGDADPDILMGSLFAIPPDVTPEDLGLTNPSAIKMFYALQDYGMYFVEDAAFDAWDIIAERGVDDEFTALYGYSLSSPEWKVELNKLMVALHVILNNTPDNIGGGGVPRQPLAPDFDIEFLDAIADVPENLFNGLNYKYYEGVWEVLPDFDTLTPVAEGLTSYFDLSVGDPTRLDNFAIQFEGFIEIEEQGEYVFYLASDDGSKLYINDQLIIDNDGLNSAEIEIEAYVGLREGFHKFRIDYFEAGGGEELIVSIADSDDSRNTKELLPETLLFNQVELREADTPEITVQGLEYRYFEEDGLTLIPDLTTLTPVQEGVVENFDISVRPSERFDNFLFEFSGFIEVPEDGVYTFFLESDDGSELYIGDQLVVDNDPFVFGVRKSGTIGLKAGKHALKVVYLEAGGGEFINVSYANTTIPGEINEIPIPSEVLSRAIQLKDAETPEITVQGLEYRYFEEDGLTQIPDLTTLTAVQEGVVENFDISVRPSERFDNFLFEFSGFIEVPEDGVYTFFLESDDGSELYIGDQLVVDNDPFIFGVKKSGVIGLRAGKHTLRVVYLEVGGGEFINVSYASTTNTTETPETLIPSEVLSRAIQLKDAETPELTVQGLEYRYFEEDGLTQIPDLTTLTAVQEGVVENFDISVRPSERFDNFLFEFSGFIEVPEDGIYTFFLESDDGSELYIGDQLVVDNDPFVFGVKKSGVIGLRAGKHTLRVVYLEVGGGEFINVSYASTTNTTETPETLIPSEILSRSVILRTADNPAFTVQGLNYRYFEEDGLTQIPDLTNLIPVQEGVVENFDISVRPPERFDNFLFEYTGFLEVPNDGVYRFTLESDDGSELFIGDELVVDNDPFVFGVKKSGEIGLRAGKHALTLLYLEVGGGEFVNVSFENIVDAASEEILIPSANLFREVPAPTAAVKPVLENGGKVIDNGDGTYTALFGYKNDNQINVDIPVGDANRFSPNPRDRGQVTTFLSGRQRGVYEVSLQPGETIVWTLRGPDGRNRTSTASAPEDSWVTLKMNPIADEAPQLDFDVQEDSEIQVVVYNQDGRVVAKEYYAVTEGTSSKVVKTDLQNGIYFVHVINDGKIERLKIVSQK